MKWLWSLDSLIRTTKVKILCRLERIFSRVFLGPHASGVHVVAIGLLLHAGSVRSQESGPPPRLCGEIFLVAAMPLQVDQCPQLYDR